MEERNRSPLKVVRGSKFLSNSRFAAEGVQLAHSEAAAAGSKPRIALSEKEFGKY